MLFYRFFIWLYPKMAWLIGFYNPKARLWVSGRRKIFRSLSAALHNNHRPVVWMHCASLGEFEQGLPVLEAIKEQYPGYFILLSFFSPSGYEAKKDFPGADHICYLPMDSPAHANRFFNIVQPSLVLFVKYEFWYYYLQEAKQRNIPAVLVSGIFRKDQPFFKWYGNMHRKMLGFFSVLTVQTNQAALLLKGIGITDHVTVTGDTRFDRVMSIAGHFSPLTVIEDFCGRKPVIVAGSTWTEDDETLDHFANTYQDVKLIIAPHDIDSDRIQECLTLYRQSVLYSAYEKADAGSREALSDKNVLIIDNIGMLSRLYHYAHTCYVGGGFGDDGIHNILEAAVYGKPVVFGPVYDKYMEAEELLDAGGAFSIEDSLELESVFNDLLSNQELYSKASLASLEYVRKNAGATQSVMDIIQLKRLLIN